MTEAHVVIGKLIGNYRVASEIASTSVSCTYRGARIAPPEGPVAIKVWHTLDLSPPQQLQFLQDVRLLTMLRHPHLLPIREGGLDGQRPYLVTDYATGGSLRERLQGQPGSPLPLAEGLSILSQVGQALQYAHHFHLTHGRLTPDHVLFTARGEVLVSDVAISALVEAAIPAREDTVSAARYRAPEQFQGGTTEASDQYALGCIGYELLTGRPPFPADELEALALKHAQECPLPPTLLNMLLPQRLEEALLTALAKEQEARHASVKDFLTAVGAASPSPRRMLPVPVTARLPLLAPSSGWFPAQPTGEMLPVLLDRQPRRGSSDPPESAETWRRSGLADTSQPTEEEDLVTLSSPLKESPLPPDGRREQGASSVAAPLNAQRTPNRPGRRETRLLVSSRGAAGEGSRSRGSRVLWRTAIILSLVVVAGIIGLTVFATRSPFAPKAAVQVTPPVALQRPSAAPSSVPSATPLPSATPTRHPSPTSSPLPTPSPAPAPVLLATPGQINAHTDCSVRGHWYSCTVTLAFPPGAQGSAFWSASSSAFPQVSFSPSAGVLSAGQQQLVSVSLRSSCPATGSLIFSSGSRATTVIWMC